MALRDRLAEADVRAPSDTTTDPLAGSPEIEGNALAEVADAALARALAQLSEGDRELLLLIAWDGLSPAEAATVLGVKPVTVRVRLLRARRRLTLALASERSDPTTCPPLSMETP